MSITYNNPSTMTTSGAPTVQRQATGILKFPAGFLWGVSSAAHQMEGGNSNNQWALWEAAGRVKSGDRSGLACDWWNNAERDFDLARDMGVNALRLSVEWSRIEPTEGCWDTAAIARYREMLAGLHKRGIRPMICLHHFTNPQWFEREAAFLSTRADRLFERFARKVVEALGEFCHDWVTFNEPNVYGALGYVLGEFPPGHTGEIRTAVRVISNLARAHARAYYAIHELQPDAEVGFAHNYVVFQAANGRSWRDRLVSRILGELFNETFLQLLENGRLPFPLHLANGHVDDVQNTCDFVGLNVYSRFHVAFRWNLSSQLFGDVFVPDHVPQGDRGVDKPYGEAYPKGIRVAVQRAARLGKPIYILENGVPDAEDRIRPWLIVHAVRELHALMAEGHDIRGYFHWSLVDNFEWSEGWRLRFGLIALDPVTQKRIVRRSGDLYREVATQNGISPEIIAKYLGSDSPALIP
jgi:beta-glucosidase